MKQIAEDFARGVIVGCIFLASLVGFLFLACVIMHGFDVIDMVLTPLQLGSGFCCSIAFFLAVGLISRRS